MIPAQRNAGAVQAVLDFLPVSTPERWLEQASGRLEMLLIDHANCEKKAAGTALSLLYRYVDRPELLMTLSRLAREELRHFEQVHEHLQARAIEYVHLTPSRYAGGLKALVRPDEPGRLVDILLMGAVVEARSCERFSALAGAGVLPEDLARFYGRLLASEARHFEQYLSLARRYAEEPIDRTLCAMLERDAELITAADTEFRFHSGPVIETGDPSQSR